MKLIPTNYEYGKSIRHKRDTYLNAFTLNPKLFEKKFLFVHQFLRLKDRSKVSVQRKVANDKIYYIFWNLEEPKEEEEYRVIINIKGRILQPRKYYQIINSPYVWYVLLKYGYVRLLRKWIGVTKWVKLSEQSRYRLEEHLETQELRVHILKLQYLKSEDFWLYNHSYFSIEEANQIFSNLNLDGIKRIYSFDHFFQDCLIDRAILNQSTKVLAKKYSRPKRTIKYWKQKAKALLEAVHNL